MNQTFQGDCIDLVDTLQDNTIDCIITSPPYYNAQHKYQRGSGFHYTMDIGEPLYVIEDFFEKVRPKLKDDAMICLNLAFSYGETGVMRPYDILNRLRKLGYFVIDQVIWWKSNPIPIQKRLTNAYELVFILCKSPKGKYYTTEYTHNVWKMPVGRGGKHSAVFPIELPLECLKHFTQEGDVVLDPFMGSGTTARACEQMNRKWIGFELNPDYVAMSPHGANASGSPSSDTSSGCSSD